jgi:hypothetical protein
MRAAMSQSLVIVTLAAACAPHSAPLRVTSDLDAWQPTHVKDAMAVLDDAARPMFARLDKSKLGADDFAELERQAQRVAVVTEKLRTFYGFNDVAEMHRAEVAKNLAAAARARDEALLRARLTEMKEDCRQCHRDREVRQPGRQRVLP